MTQPADKSHRTPVMDEKRTSRLDPIQRRRLVVDGRCSACTREDLTLEVTVGLVTIQLCGLCRPLLASLLPIRKEED